MEEHRCKVMWKFFFFTLEISYGIKAVHDGVGNRLAQYLRIKVGTVRSGSKSKLMGLHLGLLHGWWDYSPLISAFTAAAALKKLLPKKSTMVQRCEQHDQVVPIKTFLQHKSRSLPAVADAKRRDGRLGHQIL